MEDFFEILSYLILAFPLVQGILIGASALLIFYIGKNIVKKEWLKKVLIVLSATMFISVLAMFLFYSGIYTFGKPSACAERAEVSGICTAIITEYQYNAITNSCIKIVGSGCGGTTPFESLLECQNACE